MPFSDGRYCGAKKFLGPESGVVSRAADYESAALSLALCAVSSVCASPAARLFAQRGAAFVAEPAPFCFIKGAGAPDHSATLSGFMPAAGAWFGCPLTGQPVADGFFQDRQVLVFVLQGELTVKAAQRAVPVGARVVPTLRVVDEDQMMLLRDGVQFISGAHSFLLMVLGGPFHDDLGVGLWRLRRSALSSVAICPVRYRSIPISQLKCARKHVEWLGCEQAISYFFPFVYGGHEGDFALAVFGIVGGVLDREP